MGDMRVAIAAESFLPQVNGVTNSVLRIADHLRANSHEALIIAPADNDVPATCAGFPVVTIPAIPFPLYQDVRVGVTPAFVLERILADFEPDVVHAAAPFLIGSAALMAAARFSIPTVAVYQTDIPAFTELYGLSLLENASWARIRDIHQLANLTLAPSTAARDRLEEHGIPRVKLWGRGVDTGLFSPDRRDPALHAEWAPGGEVVVGYMGRLAPEKQVTDLTRLAHIPGTVQVIVGDGPSAKALQADLPEARFLGKLTGAELGRALATMDVFVHPGERETFCQAIQEALAAGVPAVAPAKGGPIDLVAPGERGFLYPPGDLDQMRAHVATLAGDEALRWRLGAAARAFTARRTWPDVCAQLIGYYEEAIAMTAGAVPDLR